MTHPVMVEGRANEGTKQGAWRPRCYCGWGCARAQLGKGRGAQQRQGGLWLWRSGYEVPTGKRVETRCAGWQGEWKVRRSGNGQRKKRSWCTGGDTRGGRGVLYRNLKVEARRQTPSAGYERSCNFEVGIQWVTNSDRWVYNAIENFDGRLHNPRHIYKVRSGRGFIGLKGCARSEPDKSRGR